MIISTFCFETDDGEVIEEFFPIGMAPASIRLDDGRLAVRSFAAEHPGLRGRRNVKAEYPKAMWSAGVHPSQRDELIKKLRSKGVRTEVNKSGDPVVHGLAEQRKVQKALDMYDRAGWY